MDLDLEKLSIYHEFDPPPGRPGKQRATLMNCYKDPAAAARLLRFLADQLDSGILRAGEGYQVTLELIGDDDNPVFIGKGE